VANACPGIEQTFQLKRVIGGLDVSGRILPVDGRFADRWGPLLAAAGRPVAAIDSLLAATACSHELTLVTRSSKDSRHAGLQVVDPWVG
jgi:predicted nucleic acid-binding protein